MAGAATPRMTERHDERPGCVPRYWDTFLDTSPADVSPENAGVVLLPVPYDGTTSYRGGSRDGPKAIIAASRHIEDYDLELDRDVSEVGIHTAAGVVTDAGGPEAMVDRVYRAVEALARGGRLLGLLGGEHTVAIGAVKALGQVYPDLSVLFLDAHADLRDEYMGTRWGHASVARRISEVCAVTQVGVRSLSADERLYATEEGIPVIFWPPRAADVGGLASRVLESLSDHVYVSVDLDVLDPSIMAAVGTPEPDGMTWREVTGLLRGVAEQRKIVGFDLTELSPREGPEACSYTAARLAYKIIGYAKV